MLKETITYVDFNGQTVTESFLFNLTKAEAIELEASVDGGLHQWMKDISAPKNPGLVIETFKKVLAKSYGEKTPDGRHFHKSEVLSSAFLATEAYSTLFTRLVTDADYASKFINQILHNPETPKTPAQEQFSQNNQPEPVQQTVIQAAPTVPEPTSAFGQAADGTTEAIPDESSEARRQEHLRVARERAAEIVRQAEQDATLGNTDLSTI